MVKLLVNRTLHKIKEITYTNSEVIFKTRKRQWSLPFSVDERIFIEFINGLGPEVYTLAVLEDILEQLVDDEVETADY